MREVAPDLAVVSEAKKGCFIASRPVADHAICALEPQHPLSIGRVTFRLCRDVWSASRDIYVWVNSALSAGALFEDTNDLA